MHKKFEFISNQILFLFSQIYSHLSNKHEVKLTYIEKILPPQNRFFLNYTKTVASNLNSSCKSNMFYPISHLSSDLNTKGEDSSCNIPTSTFIGFATFEPPPRLLEI